MLQKASTVWADTCEDLFINGLLSKLHERNSVKRLRKCKITDTTFQNWELVLARVEVADGGDYLCQASSHPPQHITTTLAIVGKRRLSHTFSSLFALSEN